MSFILTKPANSLSSIPGTFRNNIQIGVGTTEKIDSILFKSLISTKYIVTVIDATLNKLSSFEVLVTGKLSDPSPSYTRYGTVGDLINVEFSAIISNHQLIVQITNNDISNISVNIVRIQTIV